jgi:hypothetical protein
VAKSSEERQQPGLARAAWGKGMELTGEAHGSARGERGGELGKRRNSVEKAYSREYSKGSRVDWAKQRGNGLLGGASRHREDGVG